jgi:hypothetical protein
MTDHRPATKCYTPLREENLDYSLYRGRPPLSQSLRPARPPEEEERGAGREEKTLKTGSERLLGV